MNPKDTEFEFTYDEEEKKKEDDYLVKVVIDVNNRFFRLFSNSGDMKHINCDSMNEFMNVLKVCRKLLDDDMIEYIDPLVK